MAFDAGMQETVMNMRRTCVSCFCLFTKNQSVVHFECLYGVFEAGSGERTFDSDPPEASRALAGRAFPGVPGRGDSAGDDEAE